jgi:hypothetical protein
MRRVTMFNRNEDRRMEAQDMAQEIYQNSREGMIDREIESQNFREDVSRPERVIHLNSKFGRDMFDLARKYADKCEEGTAPGKNKSAGHYIPCPECEGVGGHERYCDCGGLGCSLCGGKGIVFSPCNTCKDGEGQVWVQDDDGLEIYK